MKKRISLIFSAFLLIAAASSMGHTVYAQETAAAADPQFFSSAAASDHVTGQAHRMRLIAEGDSEDGYTRYHQQKDVFDHGLWKNVCWDRLTDWNWHFDFTSLRKTMQDDWQRMRQELGNQLSENVDGTFVMIISLNGKEQKLGPYSTQKELVQSVKDYCQEQTAAGNMTEALADHFILQAEYPFSDQEFDWFQD